MSEQPTEQAQLIPAENAALVRGSALLVRRGLVEFRSRQARAVFERGISEFQAEDYQAAIASFTEAIRLDPSYDAAYEWCHRAYSSLSKLPELIAVYTNMLRADPASARAYYYRGYARDFTNAAALADYTEAIRLNPDYGLAYYMRGLAHFLAPKGDAAAAMADFSHAIRLNPARQDTYLLRSLLYRKVGNYDAALADCSTAIALDPSYAAAYYDRADTHKMLGNFADAINDYEQYLELEATALPRRRELEATISDLRHQLQQTQQSSDSSTPRAAKTYPH